MTHTYDFPRPALTVDCVVFGLDLREDALRIMLIERDAAPFKGRWALPGGFVKMNESIDEAAMRKLREETGIEGVFLEQLYTFGEVSRDPRERVVSVAYYALVSLEGHAIEAGTDALAAAWFSIDDLPSLAFDHDSIVDVAIQRLKGKIVYEPIGFKLLPERFTLSELQRMYETILGRSVDKRNFRKKILGMGLLKELNEVQMDVAHRAARLYEFDEKKYSQLKEKGFNFEL